MQGLYFIRWAVEAETKAGNIIYLMI